MLGNFNLNFLVLKKQSLWWTLEFTHLLFFFTSLFLVSFFQYTVPLNVILYNSLFDSFYRFLLKVLFGLIWFSCWFCFLLMSLSNSTQCSIWHDSVHCWVYFYMFFCRLLVKAFLAAQLDSLNCFVSIL